MRLQKCIHFYSAISVTNAMSKKPTFFKGDLVANWMGDPWDPRTKSGLQLEKYFFISNFFLPFLSFWAFSFNIQICELIRVVKTCIFCSKLIIDFSDKMKLSVYS